MKGLDHIFEMMPSIRNSPIKRLSSGPFCHSTDNSPIVSKVIGLDNLYVGCAFNSSEAMSSGGAGKLLSELVLNDD